MTINSIDFQERTVGKDLYEYQHDAIEKIFEEIEKHPDHINLLFQLPTGGGKTVIFSEFARRYIQQYQKKVLVLTHRIELCRQTSDMLNEFEVKNKIISSKVKELPDEDDYHCFVAMVETLKNRFRDEAIELKNLGLIIIDEAHYNAFRKLFKYFENHIILGVTATPMSSNNKYPMKEYYNELIMGHSIQELINRRFLSKANYYSYNVRLGALRIGSNGDYTVESSERLYSNELMQEKLLHAYFEHSKGKKTLIFNNGINTSLEVERTFRMAGYPVRHLDHSCTDVERRDILKWFKETPDAILTSVSILTTGFDEPSIETIIINRATRSLTLYHQMIGRGSRVLPNKSEFNIIDLGNNIHRFGLWHEFVNWREIFKYPEQFVDNIRSDDEIERDFIYLMPDEIKKKFALSKDITIDIKKEHQKAIELGFKSNRVMELSMLQHAKMCAENSDGDIDEAFKLIELLDEDIDDRIRRYSYCIAKGTDNYLQWLKEDYLTKLRINTRKKVMELLQA